MRPTGFGVRRSFVAGRPTVADRRQAADLLHQQCWCWGRDVSHPDGNLLLAYGGTRVRRDDGASGGTSYRWHTAGGDVVCLWGFGLFFGRGSRGIFLARGQRGVRLTPQGWSPPLHLHTPDDLPALRVPVRATERAAAAGLAAAASAWVAAYEKWVIARLGPAYRHRALAKWERTVVPPESMAAAWTRVGQRWASSIQLVLPTPLV